MAQVSQMAHNTLLGVLRGDRFKELRDIAVLLSPENELWSRKQGLLKAIQSNWAALGIDDTEYIACLSVRNSKPVCLFYNLERGCTNAEHPKGCALHYCIFCGNSGHCFKFQDFFQDPNTSKSNPCALFRRVAEQFWMLCKDLQAQCGNCNPLDVAKSLIGGTTPIVFTKAQSPQGKQVAAKATPGARPTSAISAKGGSGAAAPTDASKSSPKRSAPQLAEVPASQEAERAADESAEVQVPTSADRVEHEKRCLLESEGHTAIVTELGGATDLSETDVLVWCKCVKCKIYHNMTQHDVYVGKVIKKSADRPIQAAVKLFSEEKRDCMEHELKILINSAATNALAELLGANKQMRIFATRRYPATLHQYLRRTEDAPSLADRLKVGRLLVDRFLALSAPQDGEDGLLHGDIKPLNIVLGFGQDGKVNDLRFIDFELSRALAPHATHVTKTAMGTSGYSQQWVHPELYWYVSRQGQCQPRREWELYSLVHVLGETLLRRPGDADAPVLLPDRFKDVLRWQRGVLDATLADDAAPEEEPRLVDVRTFFAAPLAEAADEHEATIGKTLARQLLDAYFAFAQGLMQRTTRCRVEEMEKNFSTVPWLCSKLQMFAKVVIWREVNLQIPNNDPLPDFLQGFVRQQGWAPPFNVGNFVRQLRNHMCHSGDLALLDQPAILAAPIMSDICRVIFQLD